MDTLMFVLAMFFIIQCLLLDIGYFTSGKRIYTNTLKSRIKALKLQVNWVDLGIGCCFDRENHNLFKGYVDDIDACKKKCLGYGERCKFVEYGWKNGKWCFVVSADAICTTLKKGPNDCGSAGNNGVHSYEYTKDEVKCCREKGVPSVCFGYCEKTTRDGERSVIKAGICQKWFKVIGKCRGKQTDITSTSANISIKPSTTPFDVNSYSKTTVKPSIVNGGWTSWGNYRQCSRSCGPGTKVKQRTCTNPRPNHGGSQCTGESSSSTSCKLKECPAACQTHSDCRADTPICRQGTCTECKTVPKGVLLGGETCVFPYLDCTWQTKDDNDGKCKNRTECLPRYVDGPTPLYVCSTNARYDDQIKKLGVCEDDCPKSIPKITV